MSEKEEEQQKPAEPPQEKAAEKKPEEKPKAESKVEAKEAKTEEKPKEGAGQKKRPKVSRMTLQEVEKELKAVQEKMGGFQSHFAQDLLARKKVLTESSKRS